MAQIVNNTHYNFPEPNVASSNVFFCLTNGPNLSDIQFSKIHERQKQQILEFEKLEEEIFFPWEIT